MEYIVKIITRGAPVTCVPEKNMFQIRSKEEFFEKGITLNISIMQ